MRVRIARPVFEEAQGHKRMAVAPRVCARFERRQHAQHTHRPCAYRGTWVDEGFAEELDMLLQGRGPGAPPPPTLIVIRRYGGPLVPVVWQKAPQERGQEW